MDEAVFNKYCLRIERSREDVEHAGVENGKVMDLRLRALLGVLYENFWALQGYLWVTGTPFSLEYPSLRGGFGWHDISWKHHFQV